MGEHSELGGSVMGRRLKCPGSLAFCRSIPNTSSVYAREGTAAHELAEKCLKEQKMPHMFLGQRISVNYLDFSEQMVKHHPELAGTDEQGNNFVASVEHFEVTEDMADSVGYYVTAVNQDMDRFQPGAALYVEKNFNLDWLAPGLDMFGTADAMIEQLLGKLKGYDYKHGKGVIVDAQDNVQQKFYSLGMLWDDQLKVIKPFEVIENEIWQPRAGGKLFSYAEYKVKDLVEWGHDVLLPGAKACYEPDAPFGTGDHCTFCPGLPTCPEARKDVYESAQVLFSEADKLPVGINDISLPVPDQLSPEELSHILHTANLIAPWVKSIKEFALEQMLGGVKYPNFKLVKGRKTRKWEDEEETLDKLGELCGDEIWQPEKIKTVAQLEKVIKKLNHDPKMMLEGLVGISQGTAIAPMSDKRPEHIPVVEIFKLAEEE